jgi:two-component system, OmpR family, response regulator
MRFCPLVEAASPKPAISSDGHIPTESASLTLAAVDDSVARQMVVNYLEAHEMRALSAQGRETMMDHLAQSEPDLAILDLLGLG